MSIMLLLCQPLDITSPVGSSSACEWYFRSRGASSICDQPLVTGLNTQQGFPTDAPPDTKTVPSGNNTGLTFTRDVGCVCPGAIGRLMAGCQTGDRLERLMIWNVRLLSRLPPPTIMT